MATTTNYGWPTPDDTDLVKDGAEAIRDLGSSIDSTTENLNPATTEGDLQYRGATVDTNERLAIGTAGQFLAVNSGADAPEWVPAPAGGGKVLQVVQGITTSEIINATTTYTATGVTATITPTSATSKVLVLITLTASKTQDNADSGLRARLMLNGVQEIVFQNGGGLRTYTAIRQNSEFSFNYLDSPASTSALTYLVQFANDTAAASVSVQPFSAASSITLLEIGA